MAEAKSHSTSDLFLLIAGLKKVKDPNVSADRGDDYYYEVKSNEERTLREIVLVDDYLNSPYAAWLSVRFRDWLLATLFGNITDHKHDFTAISEAVDVRYSIDLFGKTFSHDMAGVTDQIKQALTSDSGFQRTYFSTLTFGISRQVAGGKEVFLFGGGMRRRAQLWLNEQETLQADVEFFVPFFILPNSTHGFEVSSSFVRSINAGIAITNSKGNPIKTHENEELLGMRFNFRIPFKAEERTVIKEERKELHTEFGTPEVKIQKRVKGKTIWEEFTGYKKFLKEYCEETVVSDLLNSPIGPFLAEKISDGSGFPDIFLTQGKQVEIIKNLEKVKPELDDQLFLLQNIWKWQPRDKDDGDPHSGGRKLGGLLHSLGFMTAGVPSDGEIEYSFELAPDLTVWSVFNRLLDELDGFPLYVSGLNSRTDKSSRIALSLASQSSLTPPKRHYFGLAGIAYNILLNPVSEKEKEQKPKKGEPEKPPSIVLSKDNFTDDESILIDLEEDEQEEQESETGVTENKEEIKDNTQPTKVEKSRVEVLLHLGKWFSGETLDDNWLLRLMPKSEDPGKQRVPLPGIRLLPFKRVPSEQDHNKAVFSWTLLFDLLSLGVDVRGTTKDGLTFLEGLAGHFGLGAVEVRLALKVSLEDITKEKGFFDRVAIGIGVKLKDLRLSFGPKEEEDKKKKGSGDEIIEGLQNLLADDWVVVPETKSKKRTVKTRLSAKKKDKFSISVGYLTPLTAGSHGTLDIQLYDEKGNRGKMALIPIDRADGSVYLKQIGIALKGAENIELAKGLPDSAQLTISLTGGIRMPVFELGFIGAKVTFQLNNPGKNLTFGLDGLDVSVKFGAVIISGSFMKVGIEFAGSLTVSIPKGSFSAMGFYGSLLLFKVSGESDTITKLNLGFIPPKILTKLTEEKITPAGVQPVRRSPWGGWEFDDTDNKQYTISESEDKLIVLRPDKTFFIYVTLSAASGTGITLGPIQFTGIVFGYGYNRRAKMPTIENVADFPLVKMVMGQGGYQEEDETFELHNQLAKPLEDPISVLQKMKNYIVPELGQQFACGGVRFTIGGTVDCFALIVVQWGGGEIEISLLGLARFRLPRDTTARAICYIELQILMTLKPSEGTFKLQALLSNNSWIINKDCKLTGGFAVFVWFDGEHKGDLVVTLGGYHPRFQRPEHYPLVPRLGLNWPVTENLIIKGGCYYAFTPSCGMFGSRLEATFHSGRISAWFTAYLDVIINWSPVYFEAELGISLRVEARFFLTALKVTIGSSIKMWGPPVGGIAHIDLGVASFDIDFGPSRPDKPELIETWEKFCHNFLNLNGADRRPLDNPVLAFPMMQPNLAAGRNNLNNLPNSRREQSQPKPEDGIWKVRADEVELAAAATVPVTQLNVGTVKTIIPSEGVQERTTSGRSMMITKELKLDSEGLRTKKSTHNLGVHPMGRTLESVLNVTIIHDDNSVTRRVELSKWTVEEEMGALPAALWDSAKPNLTPSEPSAKLMQGCITGVRRLKPPKGTLGNNATPPAIQWHRLDPGTVPPSGPAQKPPRAGDVRNIQPVLAERQAQQKEVFTALAAAGFSFTWQSVAPAEVRFRELQANPLMGPVAA